MRTLRVGTFLLGTDPSAGRLRCGRSDAITEHLRPTSAGPRGSSSSFREATTRR